MKSLSELGKVMEADVLVIGGGLAGCFAAIKAKENGANVLLVDKGNVGKSSISTFAAGVLCAFIPGKDDFDLWMNDICVLCDYLNDQEWLKIVLEEIFDRVKELIAWGVEFERTPDGDFKRTIARGGGPGRALKNILFHGPQMMEAVARQVRKSGVKVVNRVMITDLLTYDGKVTGAVGFHTRTGEFMIFKAKATVLAAGGHYSAATFMATKMQKGSSHVMAYRAGAELMNFDFTIRNQSALPFDTLGMNEFQGLGAKFVNGKGEEFMKKYDPVLVNKSTKVMLAAAEAWEVKNGRGPIYLDMTHFTPEKVEEIKRVVPLGSKILERAGVIVGNKIVKKVEWGPGGPGTLANGGGVKINTRCESNLPGLYAAGDAAAKMAAGAHNMGAGGLTWAMVSGARAGVFAAEYAKKAEEPQVNIDQVKEFKELIYAPLRRENGIDPAHVLIEVQEIVMPYDVYIIRSEDRMKKALEEIERIKKEELPYLRARDPHELRLAHEVRCLTLVHEMHLRAGMIRKESRVCPREDYPYIDNENWLKWIILWNEDGEMKFRTEDIPIDRYPIKPKRKKYLHPIFSEGKEPAYIF